MLENVWILPALPAVAFVVILFFGKRSPGKGAAFGITAVGASFVGAIVAVVQWVHRVDHAGGSSQSLGKFAQTFLTTATSGSHAVLPVTESVTWWQNGSLKFSAGTYVDGLTVMMLVVVTLISLLVQVYSIAYMRGDRRYTWYYAALSLFTASMLTLVVADNMLLLLVGWELVGLCSFMLIGHWWEEPANSRAAIKAFLTTRTGDIGLMIGVIILFFTVGSFGIGATNLYATSAHARHDLLLAAAICLMIGIIGKSGQFPLHTWLPDAMAGPTPVSALIHAATMVVAGVYLGARVYPVFFNGFSIGARRRQLHGADRRDHDHHRGGPRVRADRHQEGPRVLDDQPARLHGDGPRGRRLDRRRVPPLHARLLQGAALPRCRLGEPLRGAHLRHA